MLLENPVEPQVIKSTANGILQHDAMTWQIEGPHFVSASLSESAISLHETLHNWLENIDENARTQFVDDLFSILESTGVDTLTQVQEGGLKMRLQCFVSFTRLYQEHGQSLKIC